MDRETYDEEVDRICTEIHQLSLERHQLYERERQLIRRLVEVRRRREATVRREQGSSSEEEDQGEEEVCGVGATENGTRKVDRFGKELKIGDTVEFLTPGRCVGKLWTVYRLTDKRVLCERNNGVFKTHREYRNVKKVENEHAFRINWEDDGE